MSSESTYSFTTKVNGDLLTVRGDTLEEWHGNLALLVANAQAVITDIGQLQAAGNAAPLVVAAAPVAVQQQPAAPAFPQQPQAPAFPTQQQPPQQQYPQQTAPSSGHVCGCGKPMKFVPGGISKKTGNSYPGFYSCAEGKPPYGCGQTVNS